MQRSVTKSSCFRICAAIALLLHIATSSTAQSPRAAVVHGADVSTRIATNDNRHAGGRLTNGVLTLDIEARDGVWHPDGNAGLGLRVAAFAEVGQPLQNPGPLVRVPQGTLVVITVRNTLSRTLTMLGLGNERGLNADSARIAPGASHEFRFRATHTGTFFYAGKTGRAPVLARSTDDTQLNGAIVVDPPRTKVSLNDRVFLISWWYVADSTSPNGLGRATMVINGLSWPHTERLDVVQGDSLHWRWINLTLLNHPMHLHGFYFDVLGQGDGAHYTVYKPEERRRAVTEILAPGGTMSLAWSPSRPGNWLFHCHMAGHMSHLMSIATEKGVPAASHAHEAGTGHGMAGLVLGIRVKPRGKAPRVVSARRSLRLLVHSQDSVYGAHPGFRYTFGETPTFGARDSIREPGPTLVLRQHEPVAITVVNRSQEAAAVHWHGIELDSYPDGVPGWSGSGASLLPSIAPGDSLTVTFTPPRAGTFMYHSHMNELQQIASGLYGAIVVLAPGEAWEPDTDRVMIFGDDGPTGNLLRGPFPSARLNGAIAPAPLEFRAGVSYRLRFINIRTDYTMTVSLGDGPTPAEWRVIAKDGAELPSHQVVRTQAQLTFAPGEIYDIEFTPVTPGDLTLAYRITEPAAPGMRSTIVPVVVR